MVSRPRANHDLIDLALPPMRFSRLLQSILILTSAVMTAVPAFAAQPKKVLVVAVTMGFRHASIPVGERVLEELGEKSGKFSVDFVRQPQGLPPAPARPRPGPKGASDRAHQEAMKTFAEQEKQYWRSVQPQFEEALQQLSPSNLRRYDAVLFLSTSGDLPLPDPKGLVDWVASGKAFIGIHAASDTFHKTGRFAGFPPYTAMLGGAFQHHGPQVTVDCIKQDPNHPACTPLPSTWTVFDEIYEFKDYDPARVHALISLEKHPQTKAPAHNGISWARNHGRGRVFYTSLGHREDIWDPTHKGDGKGGRKNSPEVSRQYQHHVLGGILWALGLENGEIKHR